MDDLVFISHSNADKAVAEAICAALERAGIRCWIAPRDITPGRMWGEAIIDGINASRVMILVHSKHSNKSPQVVREVERAVNARLLLLQVRMADIKPSRALEFYIASSQWLDAFPGPAEPYLSSLPKLVRELLDTVPTGEHSAEYSAEHAAEPLVATPDAHEAREAPPRDVEPSPGAQLPPLAISTGVSSTRKTLSPRIGSLAAAVLTIAIGGTWALSQINREEDALAVPDSLAANSGAGALASGADTVVKDTLPAKEDPGAKKDSTAKDPPPASNPPLPLRIALPAKTTYKVGDRFTLRVEPRSTEVLRWRTRNTNVVALASGGGGFQASGAGRVYVLAQRGTQRDSIRIDVVENNESKPGTPQMTGDAAGNLAARETTTASSANSAKVPALTDALAATKASECVQAIAKHDAPWVRAHYGSSLTVGDAANLKALESMFGRRQYRADRLNEPKFVGNTVTFSMRVSYQGSFGPRVSVDVPFDVRMAGDQPQANLETCRARGTLKAP